MKNIDGTDININEQRDAEDYFLKENFIGELYQEIIGD